MAVIKNKELVQSYVLTTAKYDFSVYEKRILYRIIEVLQAYLTGLKLNYNYSVQEPLYKEADADFLIELKAFLKDEKDNNYEEVKKALKSLRNKTFEYEDATEWAVYGIIEKPKITKYNSFVSLKVTPLLFEAFMNFAKGYRKYELRTAMQLESVYSMRFYELMSGQTKPLTYLIDDLKTRFKLENKYKLNADFFRKVIDVAKKELDEKSSYSFDYKINKQGKKFHSITFFPVRQLQHIDENIERQKLNNQLSLSWDLSRETIQYLKEVYLFDTKEINQHRELFKQAEKELDILVVLAKAKRYAETAKNPKGYVISVLKKEVGKLDKV